MRFVKTPAILSTAPDLSCVVIRKQNRENRDNQDCYATLIIALFWMIRYISVCVCDVTIATSIASTAANKLR